MHWGLGCGQMQKIEQGNLQGPVHHLNVDVESTLHQQVQEAATAAGGDLAPGLRHMVRRISVADFPAGWQEERSGERSHDSHDGDTRFMLRLDEPSRTKLQALVEHFDVSKADIFASSLPERLLKIFRQAGR
jgi:uncharacterized protein (DUF736 family)